MFPTLMEKWWELLFPSYYVEFLYLSEDGSSHKTCPLVPLEVAMFKGAIKAVVHGEWGNSSHIRIMELVFYKCLLLENV